MFKWISFLGRVCKLCWPIACKILRRLLLLDILALIFGLTRKIIFCKDPAISLQSYTVPLVRLSTRLLPDMRDQGSILGGYLRETGILLLVLSRYRIRKDFSHFEIPKLVPNMSKLNRVSLSFCPLLLLCLPKSSSKFKFSTSHRMPKVFRELSRCFYTIVCLPVLLNDWFAIRAKVRHPWARSFRQFSSRPPSPIL